MKENRSEAARFEILKSVFNFDEWKNIQGIWAFDDAAVINIGNNNSLIIASDFVRGTWFTLFRRGFMDYEDVWYYLISANLSDIAAMWCKPIGLTNVFRYLDDISNEDFKAVLIWMKKSCDDHGAIIVWWDIWSYQANVFTACAFGFMDSDKVLLRSAAKDWDLLCVSWDIGLPFTAIMYFDKAKKEWLQLTSEEEELLLNSWKRPKARIKCGTLIAENKLAHSCQDVSDWLRASVEQTAKASNLGCTIYEDQIPLNSVIKKVANFLKVSPISLAFSASVDFSLLFTIPKDKEEETKKLLSKNNIDLKIIWEMSLGNNLQIKTSDWELKDIPWLKWNHKSWEIVDQFMKN